MSAWSLAPVMTTLLLVGCGPSSGSPGDAAVDTAGDADAEDAAGPLLDLALPHPDFSIDGGEPCVETCPAPLGGILVDCRKRFAYGVNYAWKDFAADFGGNAAWQQAGVAGKRDQIRMDFEDMRAHGVDVVRWWLFPEFSGDGVTFDQSDRPLGLGASTLGDLEAGLELAAETDVHLELCLFSFDNFRPTREAYGIHIPGLRPIVLDAAKRMRLLEYVVRPIARAVSASPHRDRLVAWDAVNEPEWALQGSDAYGDPAYDPQTDLEPVSHAAMELFIAEVVAVLHDESPVPVTVGGAAIKWPKAWSQVALDFYSFHLYDWVNQWYPYDKTLAEYGVTDLPVVMGELPLTGLAGVPPTGPYGARPAVAYVKLVEDLFGLGYAGAKPWAFSDEAQWLAAANDVATFAAAHPCVAHY